MVCFQVLFTEGWGVQIVIFSRCVSGSQLILLLRGIILNARNVFRIVRTFSPRDACNYCINYK